MELKGIRILEVATGQAAPYAGRVLAQLGAEVIKVEPPPAGDETRDTPPRLNNGIDVAFAAYNLGKKSVTLNLDKAGPRAVFCELVKTADVVLESLPAGVMEAWGLGYEDLAPIRNGLVYASVSLCGRTGPYRALAEDDLLAQALFGMMATSGEDRNGAPVRTAFPVAEVGVGMNAAFAIAVALLGRQRTGKGQRIESTWMHTLMSFAGHVATQYDFSLTDPNHARALCLQLAPYQAYRAKDGWVVVATSNEAQWERIGSLPLVADLREDPRFKTMKDRVKNRRALAGLFERAFSGLTAREVEGLFEEVDVPCSRVNNLRDIFEHDVFREATLERVSFPGHGTVAVPKLPFFFGAFSPGSPRPAPGRGEHNRDLLAPLGYRGEDIRDLCSS